MKTTRLLIIGILHLIPFFACLYLVMARNEPAWGIIMMFVFISLTLTLNFELDRTSYK